MIRDDITTNDIISTTGDDPATRHPLPRITYVADLVAAVPSLLGFYPQHSIVAVFMRARTVVVTVRADLVGADLVEDLVQTVITDPITTAPGRYDAVALVVVSHTRRPDVAASRC